MRALATTIIALCVACGSQEAARPADPGAASSPCPGLLGKWREVEPTGDTTVEEPQDDKVQPVEQGSRLTFEPRRLTIVSKADRSESNIVVERTSTGTCLLHGRDSLGRPIDIEASLPTERLLRMHNVAEPKSPTSLYERQ